MVACTAPLAFTFGLGMLVVFPLRAGACALLTESATPAQLADLVAEHGVTVLATAPTAYKQMLASDHLQQLSGLRVAVSAGEHMAQATWEQIEEQLGLKVVDGIGATEMLHIFISAAGDDIRPGATGRPVPGYRAAILDADGNELGDGQEGRLGVIGPVGCRYLDDERQRGYVVNGWNVTGDTFVRDEDGYYFYRSRTDNMIVSSGYNIGGPEVEEALGTHPDVARGRRRRGAGRGPRLHRLRLRRAARGRRGRRRQGQGAPGPREGSAGPVQVPPRRALRRRAATQHQRQDAALQAAPDDRVRGTGGVGMKIAIAGGGPGGLYFATLMKSLDPSHDITVWERNAPDDTFGFGVVFSDETLGSIEGADRVVHERMEKRFARWTDIDVAVTDRAGDTQSFTVGGQGFAAMSPQGAAADPAGARAPSSA